MAFVAADWTIDRQTGNIRYVGDDHNEASPSYATVIEFHRALQALADNASSTGNDDELDITDNTPSDRSTDNIVTLNAPYNIDDASSEHLYDGSIIQNNLDDIYDGFVNFGNATVQIQVLQNGAIIVDDWWNKSIGGSATATGATLTDSGATFGTSDELVGYTVYNTTTGAQGIITSHTNTVITADMYDDNGGSTHGWTSGNLYEVGIPLNASSAAGISHRFMLKTRSDGADVDGRRLIGLSRRFGNTYSEFKVNGTSRGNNVFALSDAADLNNQTSPQTVQTWTAFANDSVGFDASQDVDNDTTNEEYYSRWDISTGGTPASPTINDLYEYSKFITDQMYTTTMYGVAGNLFRGITLEVVYDNLANGNFDESSYLVWGTQVAYDTEQASGITVGQFYTFSGSGAVGQLLAKDDNGTTGFAIFAIESGTVADNNIFTRVDGTANDGATVNGSPTNPEASGGVGVILADDATDTVWIQLLKGSAPVNNLPLWEATTAGVYDNATGTNALVNVTVTNREPLLTKPFLGASTGSSIIGGYGIGIASEDLTASDILFDLGNNQITPPNNVTVTISGLISGEDYVTVAQRGLRFAYDTEASGPFQVGETLTFSGSATATAVLAELVDQGTTGYMIVSEAVTGSLPTGATADNAVISGGTSSATAAINGSVSSDINKRQLTLATTLNADGITSVVVNGTIPTDTPSSGIVRVQDNNGFYRKLIYTSYTGSTFTVSNPGDTEDNFNSVNATGGAGPTGNRNVYIGYIDTLADATSEAFTAVYLADRNLFVRVRDGGTAGDGLGIKTFESTVTMGSSGGSSTAIRTSDV